MNQLCDKTEKKNDSQFSTAAYLKYILETKINNPMVLFSQDPHNS